MTYRELLKLYKEGQLDEETKKKIAADIERQDAIRPGRSGTGENGCFFGNR